jgi:hypothetical protein
MVCVELWSCLSVRTEAVATVAQRSATHRVTNAAQCNEAQGHANRSTKRSTKPIERKTRHNAMQRNAI